jgi:hypothetical protein
VIVGCHRQSPALVPAPHKERIADNVGGQDRRQFALLTGHGKFRRFLQRIVEGPAGHSSAKAVNQQASGSAKIDPLMAAFNAIAWMSANPASSQPSIFVI